MTLISGKLQPDNTLTPGSMSASIEKALEALVSVGADENPVYRRKLALAIARGVLEHIRDNVAAFTVDVPILTSSATHKVSVTVEVDIT